jgi:MFS family permease
MAFWLSQGISKLGNGVYQVGLAWSVYQLAGSAAALGSILALNAIPQLALVLLGGTLADRWSRRTMIIAADGTACLVTGLLALAALDHGLTVPALAAGAVLLGVTSAFYSPAYSALNRDLLAKPQLAMGNSLISVGNDVARTVGPALAGVIFALAGSASVFGFDAATFAVAFITMALTRIPGTRPRRSGDADRAMGVLGETVAGLRYTLGSRRLMLILAVSLIANFACLAPYLVLLPGLVRSHHGSISILGLLGSCQTIACLTAAAGLGKILPRVRPGKAMLVLIGMVGVGVLAVGVGSSAEPVLFIGAILVGVGFASDVIENTLLQTIVPVEFLSRVYSINILVSFSMTPIGYLVAGFVAAAVGGAAVLTVGGALLVVACALAAMPGTMRGLEIRTDES